MWRPSRDGTKLAYRMRQAGAEPGMIRVLDVATGKPTADLVRQSSPSAISWMGDASGFFYSHDRAPSPSRRDDQRHAVNVLSFHRLGTSAGEDRLVYATPDQPARRHLGMVADNGRWLVITSARRGLEVGGVAVADLQAPGWPIRVLMPDFESLWTYIGSDRDRLFFVTDRGAPQRRIVTLDAASTRARPVEVVPEASSRLVTATVAGDRLIVAYAGDEASVLRTFRLDGGRSDDIVLPGRGIVTALEGRRGDPEAFYLFQRPSASPIPFRYDTVTRVNHRFTAAPAVIAAGRQ